MTETIKSIMDRNSCRGFSDVPLTDEQVKALVDVALAAPSARNLQPWHLSVVTDKSLIEELDKEGVAVIKADENQEYYNLIMERGGKMFYNAPCCMIISANDSVWSQLDSGIMCQNIAIAAQSMGLGSCIVGMMARPLGGKKGDELKKRLDFPDGYKFTIGILVGNIVKGKEPHELDFGKVSYI